MGYVFIGFIIVYILISLILTPFQYKYIKQLEEMKKENQKTGKTQGEIYEEMQFEYQVLHENAQGNFLFFLANLLASIIYKIKHPKTS